MKRLQMVKNVPGTYVSQSRDFQLMCNLMDLLFNGVKFDIDSIKYLSDTTYCRESTLGLLQHKLGLELDTQITDQLLRKILKCFPFIVKKKGSRAGIEEMICLYLSIIQSDGSHNVKIYSPYTAPIAGNYIIDLEVETEGRLPNIHILENLLRYVVPTGYNINYKLYMESTGNISELTSSDSINIILIPEELGSKPRSTEYDGKGNDDDKGLPGVLNAVATTVIKVSSKDISDDPSLGKSDINALEQGADEFKYWNEPGKGGTIND